jgi:hypothetical protein
MIRTLTVISVAALLIQLPVLPAPRQTDEKCEGAQLALIRAVAQQPMDHPEIPADWFCSPQGYIKGKGPRMKHTSDQPCHCHPRATEESSCEERTEDAHCNLFCRKQSCACPATCP